MFSPLDSYPVMECAACRTRQTALQPEPEDLDLIYPPSYYGTNNRKFHRAIDSFLRFVCRGRCQHVARFFKAPGAILDVGCGSGLFLEYFRRQGWNVTGLELSENAAGKARLHIGDDAVRVGDFDRIELPESSFDAVVFWHVFEHLPRPRQCLDKVNKILKPGGMLVIAVPDSDSAQARMGRNKWFHLDVPRHVFHYSEKTLLNLLGMHGFQVTDVSHHSLEYNPFGLLQTMFNWCFPENEVYNLLRNRSAKLDSQGTLPSPGECRFFLRNFRFSLELISFLSLFPAAFVASFVLELCRQGGCITVCARNGPISPG
ncbi:MAG: class I SAM-dependent methyltransferase [Armatimonadetes bacterium]|nr:class I SAM-dependent methyltransferase [Armatimonadota bacterium]